MGNRAGTAKAGERDEAELVEERTREEVEEALRDVPVVQPVVAEDPALGGFISRRRIENDAVPGLKHDAFVQVCDTLHGKSRLQTQMLVAKQKQVHLAVRAAADSCEEARQRVQAGAEDLASQSKSLKQLAALSTEVERACQLLESCRASCQRVVDLLPADERPEPLVLLPALLPDPPAE